MINKSWLFGCFSAVWRDWIWVKSLLRAIVNQYEDLGGNDQYQWSYSPKFDFKLISTFYSRFFLQGRINKCLDLSSNLNQVWFLCVAGPVRLSAVLFLQWWSTGGAAKDIFPLRLLEESRSTQSTSQHTFTTSNNNWIMKWEIRCKPKQYWIQLWNRLNVTIKCQMLYEFYLVSVVIRCDVAYDSLCDFSQSFVAIKVQY